MGELGTAADAADLSAGSSRSRTHASPLPADKSPLTAAGTEGGEEEGSARGGDASEIFKQGRETEEGLSVGRVGKASVGCSDMLDKNLKDTCAITHVAQWHASQRRLVRGGREAESSLPDC